MELAIDIVKSILLPKLEKDTNFDSNITDATFWESFATALLDFEKDDTTCKTAISNLGLNNPERIISKLPNIYNSYVNELAENFVLGNESEAIGSLLKSKNILKRFSLSHITRWLINGLTAWLKLKKKIIFQKFISKLVINR